ncbi:hypothetical protein [Sphingobacterium kitahiroshimense]|uniref:HTH cro/C1-type domain-containing protein n=1 Tax=Sphingobacterium kitahiroshimense TaxID=470446 RepID=A0ABV0BR65_9SPHI
MKKIDFKNYSVSTFYTFVKEQLFSMTNDESFISYLLLQIENILKKENTRLTAKTFYTVINSVGLDLKVCCDLFFKNMPSVPLHSLHSPYNLFKIFFSTKTDLATASGIQEYELSRLLNGNFDDMFAYQAYALATALGLEPHSMFIMLSENKKAVFKMEFIDNETETHKSDYADTIPTLPSARYHYRKKNLAHDKIIHQYRILEYIIRHTDFFLTPRTIDEITKEIEDNYGHCIYPIGLYNFMRKYINKELRKEKIKMVKKNGNFSKKEKLIFTKISPTIRASKIEGNLDSIIQPAAEMASYHKQQIMELSLARQKEEIIHLQQLYNLILNNPGQRLPFYLTVFDVKARIIENRLRTLINTGKIQYRGKLKSGGYWAVLE